MLFSLVLAVASKEVELWQAFDDFAPRHLLEVNEEQQDPLDHEDSAHHGDEHEYETQMEAGEDEGQGHLGGVVKKVIVALACAGVVVGAIKYLSPKNPDPKTELWTKIVERVQEAVGEEAAVPVLVGVTVTPLFTALYYGTKAAPLPVDTATWLKYITENKNLVGVLTISGTLALGGSMWHFGKLPTKAEQALTKAEQAHTKAEQAHSKATEVFNDAKKALGDAIEEAKNAEEALGSLGDGDAKKEAGDAKKEADKKVKDKQKEFDDAKKKLIDAKKDLNDAKKARIDAKKALDDAKKKA